jgi:signal transduction histidine kinase
LRVSNLLRRVRSLPIFLKILGIGGLVAIVFGGTVLIRVRSSMAATLHELVRDRALLMARSLADSIEPPLATDDLLTVEQKIRRVRESEPDIRYVVVRDPGGKVLVHTFESGVPPDLVRVVPVSLPPTGEVVVLETEDGPVYGAAFPLLRGHAGSLLLGLTDRLASHELSALTRSVLRSLGASALLGIAVAFVLARLVTRPVRELEAAATRIREGDFEARARAFPGDEFGKLAQTFNDMAESLQRYRGEVRRKDESRVALLERIVQTLEDERKHLSRELHDQVGQSLLAVLLDLQGLCDFRGHPESACREIEQRLIGLVEEVQRLARGLRPRLLDDSGLESALETYVEEISGGNGIRVDFQHVVDAAGARMPRHVELTLYRVAQEALSNVVRHSRATVASVVLHRRPNHATLLVEDDGCGFLPDAVRQGTGLGLIGMRERLALIGGSLDVESAPDRGATIRARVPLEDETA